MDPFNLSQLKCVDGEAGVTILCKPGAMMLVVGFVPVTDAIDIHLTVTADIENGRERTILFFRPVKVGSDVKSRT